jgi:hypothetical protein
MSLNSIVGITTSMNSNLIYLLAAVGFLTGCCTHRSTVARNDLQSYGQYMADIQTTMGNLHILDTGDVQKTRLHSLARVSLALHGLT